MGSEYINLSNHSVKHIPLTSYLSKGQNLYVDQIIEKVRDRSLEMKHHENSLVLKQQEYGRTKSNMETHL